MKRTDKLKKVFGNEEAQAIICKWVPGFFDEPQVKMAAMLPIQTVMGNIPTEFLSDEDREKMLLELEALP